MSAWEDFTLHILSLPQSHPLLMGADMRVDGV